MLVLNWGGNMFVHIVLFKWKKDAPSKEIDKIIYDLRGLRNKISGIIGLRSGHNVSDMKDYTQTLVVSFKDKKSLDNYRIHPEHKKILSRINRYQADIIGIDFEDHS